MGLLQAIDNIFSVIVVSEILKDNNLTFDASRIILYGHSHGAYLSYLSNVFTPNLFSLIIDNSSWLYPVYMQTDRYLSINGSSSIFHYLMRSFDNDFNIYNLKYLYKNFKNKCLIHSFHGTDDNLISLSEKRNFCLPLKKCILHEISSTDINDIFKSTSHGLNSDHLLLFDYVMDNFKLNFKPKHDISIISHRIETKKYSYLFDYSSNVPFLTRHPK